MVLLLQMTVTRRALHALMASVWTHSVTVMTVLEAAIVKFQVRNYCNAASIEYLYLNFNSHFPILYR